MGYHALATLELRTPFTPLRMRADGLFADWGGARMSALTANMVLSPLPGAQAAPYALVGAGGYDVAGARPEGGFTLGVGIRLPSATRAVFIESRLHRFRRDRDAINPAYAAYERDQWRTIWTPLSLGIQF